MKLPNKYGSVHKLTGKRRKPWRVRLSDGVVYDEEKDQYKRKYKTLGYYENKQLALQALAEYNANPYDIDGQQGIYMTYDKYRSRFNKVMSRLKMEHRPHEARHTFITRAKMAGMDEYILKLIVGHAINDITEKVYTHRTMEQLKEEIRKIKS